MGTTVTDLLVTSNFNFVPSVRPYTNSVTADGQLLIGATASPNIRVATLTAGTGISITNGAGSITIAVNGAVVGETITGDSGGALSPTAGNWNILGASVAAGTSPLVTAGAGSTLTINVQRAQAIASADSTKVGLANFNSANFTVDSNGFVSLNATGFPWTDITSATQTLAINNGYVTNRGGGVTYTLPATATEGDIIRIAGKSGLWTIAQNANQQINVGSSSSTVGAGGSVASTNVGDCIEMLCTTSGASTIWRAISFVGNLTVT